MKRMKLSRQMKNMYPGILHVKRTYTATAIHMTGSTASFTSQSYDFDIQDLPNYTDIIDTFEMYRVNGIKITAIPSINSNTSDTSNFNLPIVGWVADPSISITATNENSFLTHPEYKFKRFDSPVKAYYVPGIPVTTEVNAQSMTRTAFKQWITSGNIGVNHYRFWLTFKWENLTGITQDYTVQIYITVYLSLKGYK